MVASVLTRSGHISQRLGRKKPLPTQFFGRPFVFPLELMEQKRPIIFCFQVLLMDVLYMLDLILQFRVNQLGQRHRPIPSSLPVMNGQKYLYRSSNPEHEAANTQTDAAHKHIEVEPPNHMDTKGWQWCYRFLAAIKPQGYEVSFSHEPYPSGRQTPL